MTCDDLLRALEIGDAAQRHAAHRHARECAECAAAIDRWLALKASLGVAPALSEQDRSIWRDARRELIARPRLPRILGVGAAAIAASGVVALLWPRSAPSPVPLIEVLAFSSERAEREFAALDRQLDQLDRELTTLANRIASADAKRMAAELTDQYAP